MKMKTLKSKSQITVLFDNTNIKVKMIVYIALSSISFGNSHCIHTNTVQVSMKLNVIIFLVTYLLYLL